MSEQLVGVVKAHYEQDNRDVIEVALDSGRVVRSTQKIDGSEWLEKHQAVEVNDRVALKENQWKGKTFYGIDFAATAALADGTPAAKPEKAPAGSEWPELSLADYGDALGFLLHYNLPEGTELKDMPDGYFASVNTVLIAAFKNPHTLKSLRTKAETPVDKAKDLFAEAGMELEDVKPPF